jgi:hypothetical protein
MKPRLRWANPFYAEHYLVETVIGVEEASDALRAAVVSRYSPRTWLWAREEWPVFGAVHKNRFWMRKIHALQRSYFLQEASGVISADHRGSLIHFRVGMSRTNAAILMTVLVITVLAAIVLTIAAPQALAPWPAVTWLAWPTAGAAFFVLQRLLWTNDDVFLVEFILETVRGTRVQTDQTAKLSPAKPVETIS